MLKEMKNAAFKSACKRSNFHNPVKSTAQFWCEQSDWQLQQANFWRSPCTDPVVLVQGTVTDFPDCEPLTLLLEHGHLKLDSAVDFLRALDFHGVHPFPRPTGSPVCLGRVYRVRAPEHAWARLLAACLGRVHRLRVPERAWAWLLGGAAVA